MIDTTRDLIQRLIDIADTLDGRKPLVFSQGQAMDGFTALANFQALANEARDYLAQPEPEELTEEELLAILNQAVASFPPIHPEAKALSAVEYDWELETRKARAVIAADRARWGRPAVESEPEDKVLAQVEFAKRDFDGPSDVVLAQYCDDWFYGDPERTEVDPVDLCRGAIKLFAQTPAPIPVSERLPGPEDCSHPEGECWWFDPASDGAWYIDTYQGNYTYWLPHYALPAPPATEKP